MIIVNLENNINLHLRTYKTKFMFFLHIDIVNFTELIIKTLKKYKNFYKYDWNELDS